MDGNRNVVLGASLEGDLELARERVSERVPQKVARERLRVGSRVEDLAGGDSPERAGDDVSNRVPSRAGGRDPGLGESPHGRFHVGRPHEVELEVLAGRQVTEAPGVAGRGVGEGAQLIGGHGTLGELDPQHVDPFLPLTVHAARHADGAPGIGVDLATLEAAEILDERGDLRFIREANGGTARCCCTGECHGNPFRPTVRLPGGRQLQTA